MSHLGFRFRFLLACVVVSGALSCAPGALEPRTSPSAPAASISQRLGSGYYLTQPPADLELPGNSQKQPVVPKVTADFQGPATSNDWWSSLIWQNDSNGKNPYSEAMYAHPLTFRAEAAGLGLGYPTLPEVRSDQYMYYHAKEVLVGLQGLAASATRVASYSDWVVTASWRDGASELRATIGHGLPFVYLTRTGTAPALIAPQHGTSQHAPFEVQVWHQGGDWLGFSVAGHEYAVFGPSGSEWQASGDCFTSDLAGKSYFSLAVLPDQSAATVALFRAHAYAFVTGSEVSWRYDAPAATLHSTFQVSTELKEAGHGHVNQALLALYRHQWLNTKAPLRSESYLSPRGQMKLLEGSSFETELAFNGVLPILPNVAQSDRDDLEFYIKQLYYQPDLFPKGPGEKPERDTYWVGKSLLKVANALQIADQIGYESAKDQLLQALKNQLEDWFDGRAPSAFYYDKNWRSLIGVPAGFFSGLQLNDHHFHYGYYTFAAAIVAKYDAAWAKRWAPNVELLIKDAANWERSDQRFPFLRYMDAYAGHSWANGPAQFAEGNNEESASEDVNFSAGAVLWGALTGNRAIRDMGIFLYTQQVSAMEQYWWDIDGQVFPKRFEHAAVAMVWGAGARHDTWWSHDPIFVHGINFMPATGGALFMGRHPEYVRRNYAEIVTENRAEPLTWRDVTWMYLALADPNRALELYEKDRYFKPEFGNSNAMTYHWLENLAALGQLDTSVRADTPTYAVFHKGKRRTHIAFNPGGQALEVHFSDGATLNVPARQTAMLR
ncbi:MAG: glycosyl hydrolase [Pseudomonadota bacterium]